MTDSKPVGLLQQARKFLKAGEIDKAIETYQRIINTKPSEKKAHTGIASAYFQLKQYPEAIQHFEKLTGLAPADSSPHINIGAIYNRMEEYQQALRALRKAVQKDKKSADAFYNMGIAHKGLNQLSMAVAAYKQAVKFAPDMIDAHFNLGNVYLEMKNFTQAQLSFSRSLEISPQFKKASNALKILEIETTKEKQNINPFGRLVNESSLRKKDVTRSIRNLTTEEREADRRELHSLCEEVGEISELVVEDMRKEFAPSLLILNRCISQGEKHYSELEKTNDIFQHRVKILKEARKQLKKKMLKMRAHEEFVNAISIDK
ncbi:MAG: tetratricopeptide repeat protein [Gimesia sp.]